MLLVALLFAKRVYVFFDGTWATPEQQTNIYKMFAAIPGIEEPNPFINPYNIGSLVKSSGEDKAIYVNGLATNDADNSNLHGITGFGIERFVLIAYEFLLTNLMEGDWLYLFGFSRGGTQARFLAKYLYEYGLAPENLLEFRLENTIVHLEPSIVGRPVTIEFMGLFDSVVAISHMSDVFQSFVHEAFYANMMKRAYPPRLSKRAWYDSFVQGTKLVFGMAVNDVKDAYESTLNTGRAFYASVTSPFRSYDLAKYTDEVTPNVLWCFHAVAINEYRAQNDFSSIGLRDGFEEKHFVGSHVDIGGYNSRERQFIALKWMAEKTGLGPLFDAALPIGFDENISGVNAPIFDSYKNPFSSLQNDNWFTRTIVPAVNRNLPSLNWDVVHPSVIVFAQALGILTEETIDIEKVKAKLSDVL